MEPITAGLSGMTVGEVGKTLMVTNALKDAVERNDVSPLILAASGLNFAVNREYAGLLNGFLNASARLEDYMDKLGLGEKWGHALETLGDAMVVAQNEARSLVLKAGIEKWQVSELKDKVDWKAFGVESPEAVTYGKPDFDNGLERAFSACDDVTCNPYKILVPLEKMAEWEQHMLGWCDQRGILLTSKRIDYVFGSKYVEGFNTHVPLIGSFFNIKDKLTLGVDVTKMDLVRAGVDAFAIVTLVAAPYVFPAAGAVSTLAVSSQFALKGAVIGGVHNGLIRGAYTLTETGDKVEALKAAGAGIVTGAAVGAVGGAAAGAALGKLAAANGLKPIPPSFRPWAVSTGVGGFAGGSAGALQGAIDGYKSGGLEGALSGMVEGAGKGAVAGAILGPAIEGTGRLVNQLRPQATVSMAEVPIDPKLADLLAKAKEGAYVAGKGDSTANFLNHVVKSLRDVEGIERPLQRMANGIYQDGRGHFHELLRAYRLNVSGDPPRAIDIPIKLSSGRNTDIDILTGTNKWIECKHRGPLSCDAKFMRQIDNMALGLKSGVVINGVNTPITKAVYVNTGSISKQAIDFAAERGVHCERFANWRKSV